MQVREFVADVSWETAVDAFLFSRKVMGVSKRTLEWHFHSLKFFRRCHEDLNLTCSPLTCPPEHLRLFLDWLNKRGCKLSSQHCYYRSVRAFFRFLVKEGLRADTPTDKVPPPKIPEPIPRTVTEEHFLRTVEAIGFKNPSGLKWHEIRNLAVFVLAFDTGARLSELLSLRICDVDLQKRMAIVRGKGQKERVIVFGVQSARLIMRYLILRRLIHEFRDDDFLFVYANGSPLDRSYIGKAWRDAQRRAGLNPLPFHGLRHGFARVWLLRGGDALSLQIIMGHSSSEMTKRYVRLWGRDLQKLHAQVSPVDKLVLKQSR